MSRPVRHLVALLGVLFACACEQQQPPAPAPGPQTPAALARHYFGSPADGKLHVYFFDVGQGDAALIISPTGRTVLVDAGPAAAGSHLANRLPELLTDKLDLVVLTHPRPDHYSGLAAAVGAVGARKLLEPQHPETPADYDALLTSLGSTGVEIFSPAPSPSAPNEPLSLPLGGDAVLTVLWPRAPTEPLLTGESASEANSIVLRLTYKATTVLLTGDAREQTESHLLAREMPVRATLLKVGAHGAGSASSAAFLAAVHPRAAIISADVANTPDKAVLNRLESVKARVFRTDRDGEVHAVSDGQQFTLTTQRLPAGAQPATGNVFVGLDNTPVATAAVQPASGRVPSKGEANPTRLATAGEAGKAQTGTKSDIDLEAGSAATPKATSVTKPGKDERASPAASGKMQTYVASRKSKLFHVPSCPGAKQIKPANLVTFKTRAEAMQHNEPARDCKP
ncbi:ComEC/Rec2 family competence protein [Archangium sp.]|jgi:beta-lactamase superfamily II metal-dependent hydrolase|uniref:ComEC/Rec2 family competence protein n=1 Tax=Archangium sp. TaxID=1872627 RepID=UPI002ED895EF